MKAAHTRQISNLVQNMARVLRVPAYYFYCDEELAEYLLYYYER